MPKGVGRPKKEAVKDRPPCKKPGCQNIPPGKQSYCCREHAPYGNFGMADVIKYDPQKKRSHS